LKTPGVWLRRDLVQLLDQDVVTAIVLSQILFWCAPTNDGKSKLRVQKEGVRWLAKSSSDWNSELGISPKQASRAINVLRSRELIMTKVWKFAGNPTMHIRLSETGEGLLNLPSWPTEGSGQNSPLHPQGNSFTETPTEKTTEMEPAAETATPGKSVLPNSGGEKKNPKGAVAELISKWSDFMEKNHYAMKPITKKEYRQFKLLTEKCSPDVVTYGLDNWTSFAIRSKSAKGLSQSPGKPVVGFLLAYFDVAMDLMNEELAHIKGIAAAKAYMAQPDVVAAQPYPMPCKVEEPIISYADVDDETKQMVKAIMGGVLPAIFNTLPVPVASPGTEATADIDKATSVKPFTPTVP